MYHVFYRAGMDIPAVEVRFENLGVEAEVFVGSRILPSVINSYRIFFEVPAHLAPVQITQSCATLLHAATASDTCE